MAKYCTLHLHNVPAGGEDACADWFAKSHADALRELEGFVSADRFEVAPLQIMPDIDQPWRYLSIYEFDYEVPDRDIPALGPLIAEGHKQGVLADENDVERIYSYNLYSDWYVGPNWQQDKPLSGVSVILANFIAGREAEYHRWYDEVHIPEVSRVPGHVGMKRGRLAGTQCEPRRFCPGSDLVLCAQQTDDLMFTIKDFSARARGVSPSGIAMAPRSSAGSFARTVHYFTKVSGERWSGGIAYDGDLSFYPSDFKEQQR